MFSVGRSAFAPLFLHPSAFSLHPFQISLILLRLPPPFPKCPIGSFHLARGISPRQMLLRLLAPNVEF